MRPNTSTRNNLSEEQNDFDILNRKISELRKENEIILIGDLNARCGVLCDFIDNAYSNYDPIDDIIQENFCIDKDYLAKLNISTSRVNEDIKLNDFGHKLINLCKISGMLICNGRFKGDKEVGHFTYIDKKGKSTNDFAVISKGLLDQDIEFCVNTLNAHSDHCPIELNLVNIDIYKDNAHLYTDTSSFSSHCNVNHFVTPKLNQDKKDIFVNKMSDPYIISNLHSILELDLNSHSHIENDILESCITGLNHVLDYAAAPFTNKPNSTNHSDFTKKRNNNPWYDIECKNKKKEFDNARDVYRHTLSDTDLKNLCNIRNEYRKLCRIKRNKYKLSKTDELLNLSKYDSRLFWKKIKRKQKKSLPSCNFDNYFKNLFETCLSDLSTDTVNNINENISVNALHDEFLDAPFTMFELEKALKKLKNNKSPGFDNVINEFLKLNTPLFKEVLLYVFNALYNNSYFPEAWSIGLIIPIFKKGNPDSPENYRGITLLSCVGKLFTSLINTRLNVWAESNNKFDKNQYGFRDKKSTIDAMFILQNVVDLYLEKNSALFVSFIDLKKAFDCTNHIALWFKLEQNKISSKIINVIKNMYDKMKLCVQNSLSSMPIHPCTCANMLTNTCCQTCNSHSLNSLFIHPHAGVLQGESLSPTLFSMFLNDINQTLQVDANVGISIYQFYLALLLFADDMVLFSDNRFGLQTGLDKVYEYCNNWGLIVNVEKTKCLVFKKNGRKNVLDKWFYNGEEIETVSTFKYLGFVFSNTGKFSKGIENVVLQGQRALFSLYANIIDFESMFINMQFSLFDSLITSVLLYGCEIWGFAEAKKIETFHLSFLKHSLKVKKSTPNSFVYQECNRHPLYINRILRIIGYWLKIIALDENDPLKILYYTTIDVNKNDSFIKSNFWAINVRNILYKNGFGYIWENQNLGISKDFFRIFKTRLIDSFWQENKIEIDSLSTHRLFRHLDKCSNDYLVSMPNDFIRIALSRLRLGSHHLNIERGRWHKIEFLDRKCCMCNDIEDEFHFVLICPRFHEFRKKYLPYDLYNNPSMYKFIKFLNSNDLLKIRKLGIFLHNAFKTYEAAELF